MRLSPNESSSLCHSTCKTGDRKKAHGTKISSNRIRILELRSEFTMILCVCECFVRFTLNWHSSCSSCDDCRTWIKSFSVSAHTLRLDVEGRILCGLFIIVDSTSKIFASSCWSIAFQSLFSSFIWEIYWFCHWKRLEFKLCGISFLFLLIIW